MSVSLATPALFVPRHAVSTLAFGALVGHASTRTLAELKPDRCA